MHNKRPRLSILIFLTLTLASAIAEYSPWSGFGGLALIYNSDGSGISTVPIMKSNGDPGGLNSAPSLLPAFLGFEYRYPWKPDIYFAPSATLYAAQYLWADNRALPAEIENRTAYVPSLFLDAPFLFHREKDRFLFTYGGGLGILVRVAFREMGIDADTQNPGELSVGDQVKKINGYFWGSARCIYPTLQAGVRYRLETGWGAGFTLRIGLPVFNIWSNPRVPLGDSLMIMGALTITPPLSKKPSPTSIE